MPNQIDGLQDIQLPDPISAWQLAWGWWVLLALMIIIATGSFIYWRKNRYRFFAKQRLVVYLNDFEQTQNLHLYCQQAAQLLRELAITRYGREAVSSLSGRAWIIFLNTKVKTPLFNDNIADYLTQAPFCDADYFNAHFDKADVTQLHQQLLIWVRRHQ